MANGASSFHLWWQLPAGAPLTEVAVTLTVLRPPSVTALYFWALQVGFADRGRRLGAAHTGLQWHPGAPGGAVNWGGYHPDGGELAGTDSALPTVDSINTRSWPWEPGVPYRFRVWSPEPGRWRASVTDDAAGRTAVIRDLMVGATELVEPVVWAEVFAACTDPPTEVRWSALSAVDSSGRARHPVTAAVTYQSRANGGCPNTGAWADGAALHQATGLPRRRPPRRPETLKLQ